MGDTRTVDQGSLNILSNSVNKLADSAYQVRGVVDTVRGKANNIDEEIKTVKREFDAFRDFDEQQNELARAKTQIVSVRQQVQEKFGDNDKVRQYLTGILEASDLSIVRQNIISAGVERLMIACPEYWLAPCLVAISAWLYDDKKLAERALTEALKRDDEKSSLLLALVCRRAGRMQASAAWLERYLGVQDPRQVERKMVTVLDAYSNGLFGPQSKELCAAKIEDWITELSEEDGFVEAQQESWENTLLSMTDGNSFASQYPYSAKYGKNWSDCNQSINDVALHQKLLNYFKGIFEKPNAANISLNMRLDEMMENYISSYDNEELPLRREERLLELIIDEKGRRKRAEERFASEQKALEETFDFTQLLTSAAMHAEVIKASNATQRLAIALSKNWMISAYENVVMKIRNKVPRRFEFEIEGWRQSTVDGSEEAQLCSEATQEFSRRRDAEIDAVVQSKWDAVLPIICAVVAIFGLFSDKTWLFIGLIGAAGFALRWYLNKKNCEKRREDIRVRYEDIIRDVNSVVRVLCAERIDYMRDVSEREAIGEQTYGYINQISVGQYVGTGGQRTMIR